MKKIFSIIPLLLLAIAWPLLGSELKRTDSCGSLHTARGSSDDLATGYSSEDISNPSELVPAVHFSWRHVQAYRKEYPVLLQEMQNVDWAKYPIPASAKGEDSLSVKSGVHPVPSIQSTKPSVVHPSPCVSPNLIVDRTYDDSQKNLNDFNKSDHREQTRLRLLRENFMKEKQQEPKSLFSRMIEHPYKVAIVCTCIVASCIYAGMSWFHKK